MKLEEDYIKLILELQIETKKSVIKNNEIKDDLVYTNQNVNNMIKNFLNQKLVKFKYYMKTALNKNILKNQKA